MYPQPLIDNYTQWPLVSSQISLQKLTKVWSETVFSSQLRQINQRIIALDKHTWYIFTS